MVILSDSIVTAFQAETDLTDLDDYTLYAGTGRRLITVPLTGDLMMV